MTSKFPLFETKECLPGEHGPTDVPLVKGILVDVGSAVDKEALILDALREMKKQKRDEGKAFDPPYMVMDLGMPNEIELEKGSYSEEGADNVSDDYALTPFVKLLVPISQLVDLSRVATPGTSTVKCNEMVPAYRWFQAANLFMHSKRELPRFIPFPLDDEDDKTTFHMLVVTPDEFKLYQEVLSYSIQEVGLDKGFKIAAKISYEILKNRGVKKISANEVDQMIVHVMLGHNNGTCEGVMLHRAAKSDLEDLQNSHFIHY